MTTQSGDARRGEAVDINRTRDPGGEIDPLRPCVARVYDYLLGGTANFAADRAAADRAAEALPGGMTAARTIARANRDFIGRAVTYLAGEVGIRQFLDLGTGIPSGDNVHAVAQAVAPASRIVCADYDPIVLAHAHQLMRSTPEGAATFLRGDFRDVDDVLNRAAATIDFGKPVAVLFIALLHFFSDDDDPYEMVARYMDATAPGSHLVITHGTADFFDMEEASERLTGAMTESIVLRTRDRVVRFFDGLELTEPGIVAVNHWRGDPEAGPDDTAPVGYHAGVALKPA